METRSAQQIGAMFSRISGRYDLLNRLMTLGLDQRWRREAIRGLVADQQASRFLDLATGTGDLAFALSAQLDRMKRAYQIETVDVSEAMLTRAREKAATRGCSDRIHFHCAPIEQLPFDDHTFDGAMVAFGIRNVEAYEVALREIHRVLRHGGNLVILEAIPAESRWARALQWIHMNTVVRLLGRSLSEAMAYEYLGQSVTHFPKTAAFLSILSRSGFHPVTVKKLCFGFVGLYCGTST